MRLRSGTDPRAAGADGAAAARESEAAPRSDERVLAVAAEASAARLLMLFTIGAVTLLLAAGGVVIYLAYDRQSYLVERLQDENQRIERDHVAIGERFADQSKRVEAAIERARTAYTRGFRAGTRARALPARLRRLGRFARRGLLTPRAVPASLRRKRPLVGSYRGGYSLSWRGRPTLFASRQVRLAAWTRRAWPGGRGRVRVGGRTVLRLVGPAGIVYAWRERRATYAVLTFPASDDEGRGLIVALR